VCFLTKFHQNAKFKQDCTFVYCTHMIVNLATLKQNVMSKLSDIEEVYPAKLEEVGGNTLDHHLEAGSEKKGRKEIVKKYWYQ